MILLKILVWLFVVVLVYTVSQFTIVIYDVLNFQDKKIDRPSLIVREVLVEAVFTFVAFLTYVLGFINYDALFMRKSRTEHPPVLLVHGYMMNRAYFIYMHVRLVLDGFRVFTVNLYPPALSITKLAERVADKMDEIADKTGVNEVIVIGHSMGGLVARYYGSSPRGAGRIKKLITLASPHKGTRIAVLGTGRNAREMEPGSEFLKELGAKPFPPTHAVWSTLDNMIIPAQNAYPDNSPNTSVSCKGHIAMNYSGAVYAVVRTAVLEDNL